MSSNNSTQFRSATHLRASSGSASNNFQQPQPLKSNTPLAMLLQQPPNKSPNLRSNMNGGMSRVQSQQIHNNSASQATSNAISAQSSAIHSRTNSQKDLSFLKKFGASPQLNASHQVTRVSDTKNELGDEIRRMLLVNSSNTNISTNNNNQITSSQDKLGNSLRSKSPLVMGVGNSHQDIGQHAQQQSLNQSRPDSRYAQKGLGVDSAPRSQSTQHSRASRQKIHSNSDLNHLESHTQIQPQQQQQLHTGITAEDFKKIFPSVTTATGSTSTLTPASENFSDQLHAKRTQGTTFNNNNNMITNNPQQMTTQTAIYNSMQQQKYMRHNRQESAPSVSEQFFKQQSQGAPSSSQSQGLGGANMNILKQSFQAVPAGYYNSNSNNTMNHQQTSGNQTKFAQDRQIAYSRDESPYAARVKRVIGTNGAVGVTQSVDSNLRKYLPGYRQSNETNSPSPPPPVIVNKHANTQKNIDATSQSRMTPSTANTSNATGTAANASSHSPLFRVRGSTPKSMQNLSQILAPKVLQNQQQQRLQQQALSQSQQQQYGQQTGFSGENQGMGQAENQMINSNQDMLHQKMPSKNSSSIRSEQSIPSSSALQAKLNLPLRNPSNSQISQEKQEKQEQESQKLYQQLLQQQKEKLRQQKQQEANSPLLVSDKPRPSSKLQKEQPSQVQQSTGRPSSSSRSNLQTNVSGRSENTTSEHNLNSYNGEESSGSEKTPIRSGLIKMQKVQNSTNSSTANSASTTAVTTAMNTANESNKNPKVSPQLHPTVVDNYLKNVEEIPASAVEKKKWINGYDVKTKAGSNYNGPKTNQDNYIIHTNLNQRADRYIFAVCDGHGINGHHCSALLRRVLPKKIEDALARDVNNTALDFIENSLNLAFLQASKELLESEIDCTFSGSTCVLLLIIGSQVWSANAGDSRAILCKQTPQQQSHSNSSSSSSNNSPTSSEGWAVTELSRDHKPDEPSEYQRIIARGGRVETYRDEENNQVGPYRVWLKHENIPGLAMARSFGDVIASQVGVTCEPEVKSFKLSSMDRFIVVASDGVWEFLSNQEIMNMVVPFYKRSGEIASACTKVVKHSVASWKEVTQASETYFGQTPTITSGIDPPKREMLFYGDLSMNLSV